MYIKKIKNFLPDYNNLEVSDYLNILKNSNKEFSLIKLEKDFLLTLILIKFWEKYPDLIFKWWTCLNKIYFPYFRLSEDLDFVINEDIWRTARQTLLKKYEEDFVKDLWLLWLKLRDERTKFDEHKLAMFTFEYKSILDNSDQTIKIDISLKGKLYLQPMKWKIKSNFKDIVLEENIFWEHFINSINIKEAISEKLRASLTRKEPAIRDFFDIWYVRKNSDFNFSDEKFINLLDIKLKEVDYKYTLENNLENLKNQIETDLIPVLNDDFWFNFEEIFKFILSFKK